MSETLRGKVALVTGGGSGIGREMAKLFAARGARVIAADIDTAAVQETLAQMTGTDATAATLDVTSEESWTALRDRISKSHGRCDILCNNAGIFRVGALAGSPLSDWIVQSRVNVDGVVIGCHTFVPGMIAQGSGVIVNTASLSGLIPAPELSTYTASKFAVVGFSQSLHYELADQGVRVMVLAPGAIDTPMNEGVDVPLEDRLIPPSEVAAAVLAAVEEDNGRQFIFTHPEFQGMLEQHCATTVREFAEYATGAMGADR